MTNGVVARILPNKGFGFIKNDNGGEEYFFHKDECLANFDNLKEGDRVTFEAGSGPKGARAKRVDVEV